MSRKAKWTKEEINQHLKNGDRAIELISDINFLILKNSYSWKCNNYNYIWNASLSSILRSINCRKCAHNLTNEDIDKKLIGRNIKRIDNYTKSSIPINFQCLISGCGYVWKTTTNSITSYKSGCPKCSKCIKITNEDIDYKLIDRNIKRIGDIINVDTPIEFKCLIETCNNIWKSSPANIINHGRGCPLCCRKNEKICIDILRQYYKLLHNFHLYKINNSISKYYSVDIFIKIESSKYIGIAIEYNGIQHYIPTTFGKLSQKRAADNLLEQQHRDNEKRNFCATNRIKLIEIDGRIYKNEKLKDYILYTIIPEINTILYQ